MSHGLYLAVRAAHVGVESSERETKQFKIFFLGVVQIPDSRIRIPESGFRDRTRTRTRTASSPGMGGSVSSAPFASAFDRASRRYVHNSRRALGAAAL